MGVKVCLQRWGASIETLQEYFGEMEAPVLGQE